MIKTWDRFNIVGFGQNVFMLAMQAGLTGLLVKEWSENKATPADVVFAISAFIVMASYMRNFSEISRMLQRGLDDTMDVAAYMRTPPQLADRRMRSVSTPNWARSRSRRSGSAMTATITRSTATSA